MIEIELPDGSIAEFPDGTSDAAITGALKKYMPAPPAQGVTSQAGIATQGLPERGMPGTGGKGDMLPGDVVRADPGISGVSGLGFNWGDEMASAAAAAAGKDIIQPEDPMQPHNRPSDLPHFSERFAQNQARMEAIQERTRQEMPGTELAMRLGPQALAAVPLGMAAPGLAGAIGSGMGMGAVAGAGEGSGIADRATRGLAGGGLGGLFGAAGHGVSKALAAGLRKVLRGGGDEAAQAAQQAIKEMDDVGVAPTVSQIARGKGVAPLVEKMTGSNIFTGGGLRKALDTQQDVLAKQMPKGGPLADVGEGVSRAGNKFVDSFNKRGAELYGAIKATGGLRPGKTLNALESLTDPTPGAPRLSGELASKDLKKWLVALQDDLADDGFVSFDTLKRLRTAMGSKLSGSNLRADYDKGELKRIYGAITDDMEEFAKQSGSGALRQFKRANEYWKAGVQRIDEVIEPTIKGKTGEQIVSKIGSGNMGEKNLWALRRSMPAKDWQKTASTIADRMGKASAGKQDEAGSVFSSETFLTSWNKLTPQQRTALFPKDMGDSLTKIAKAASNIRASSQVGANPSGTAQATGNLLAGSGVIGSVLSGNLPAMGVAGGTLAAGRGAAALMKNRAFINWLARATDLSGDSLGKHIGNLTALARDNEDISQHLLQLQDELKDQDRIGG